jgi:hypothetical protein
MWDGRSWRLQVAGTVMRYRRIMRRFATIARQVVCLCDDDRTRVVFAAATIRPARLLASRREFATEILQTRIVNCARYRVDLPKAWFQVVRTLRRSEG